MDVGSQLARLNDEVETLGPKLDAARCSLTNAKTPEKRALAKEIYDDLKRKEEGLDAMRAQLVAQLPGATGVQAGGGAAGLTPAQALGQSLPQIPLPEWLPASSSNSTRFEFVPDEVLPWSDEATPGDPASGGLDQAIISCQNNANTTYASSDPLVLPVKLASPSSSEAALASHWQSAVMEPHNTLLCSQGPDPKRAPCWEQQPPTGILQAATAYGFGPARAATVQVPSSSAPERFTQFGRVVRPPQRYEGLSNTAGAPDSSSSRGSSKRKMDFVLMVHDGEEQSGLGSASGSGQDASQPASQPPAATSSQPPESQQPIKRRCICVGEVKAAPQLAELREGKPQPIDLVAAWNNQEDPFHARVYHVLRQEFTYLTLWRACFGYITCWYGTWLVYCPPKERRRLYVSHAFMSSSSHDPGPAGRAAATARGAVAYVQERALASASDGPADAHPGPLGEGGRAASGGGGAGTSGNGAGSEDEDDLEHDQQHCGAASRSDPDYVPSDDCGSSGNAQLELGRQLCEGSNGMVVEGKCDGTPAVIKLLGPDRHGLAAFQRELHAYSQLQAVQGSAVPRLLAAGRLPGGVHFIASQLIKGQPLAALPSITVPVAAAASRALASVHTACPSLCHGDVRLENVMLLAEQQGHSSSSSSSIQPSCVVIDFGQSWFGASAAHQLQERQWLQRLLQARARTGDAT